LSNNQTKVLYSSCTLDVNYGKSSTAKNYTLRRAPIAAAEERNRANPFVGLRICSSSL
jgi:hypothetical protein